MEGVLVMGTPKDKQDIADLKTDMALVKKDIHYMKKDLGKVVDFVDDNKSGITTASLLNNKIITVVLGAIVAMALYLIGKGGV